METLAELLATGDSRYLLLSVIALVAGAVLVPLAVRLRPRTRRSAGR